MKQFLLLLLLPLFLLSGCAKGNDDINSDSDSVTITWDGLELFDLSSVNRIDVTTERGTEQCEFKNGKLKLPYTPDTIIGLRIYFSGNTANIYLDSNDFTFTNGVIVITRIVPSGVVLVHDRATLELVREDLSGNYLQICDIDLSGENWVPIGISSNSFTGSYDGGGYAIRNMTINISSSATVYAGLFGYNRGILRNIHLDATCSVSGKSTNGYARCGGVCGSNYYGTITSCYNSGQVSGESEKTGDDGEASCGGICGHNYGGTIASCYNAGQVSGKATGHYGSGCFGGVCGENSGGAIISCYNTGKVNGKTINAVAYCGGVCGDNYKGKIVLCYNIGSVSGESTNSGIYCGGVCGSASSYSATTSCYNAGSVSGQGSNVRCGGVCGANNGTISACYNTHR